MSGFLDVTEDLLLSGEFGEETPDLMEKYKQIRMLQQVQAKSYLDLDNIEEIFSALEMAYLVQQFADFELDKINEIREGLISLIVKTLEHRVVFSYTSTTEGKGHHFTPTYEYREFANGLKESFINWSIITFGEYTLTSGRTYDILLVIRKPENEISDD